MSCFLRSFQGPGVRTGLNDTTGTWESPHSPAAIGRFRPPVPSLCMPGTKGEWIHTPHAMGNTPYTLVVVSRAILNIRFSG